MVRITWFSLYYILFAGHAAQRLFIARVHDQMYHHATTAHQASAWCGGVRQADIVLCFSEKADVATRTLPGDGGASAPVGDIRYACRQHYAYLEKFALLWRLRRWVLAGLNLLAPALGMRTLRVALRAPPRAPTGSL